MSAPESGCIPKKQMQLFESEAQKSSGSSTIFSLSKSLQKKVPIEKRLRTKNSVNRLYLRHPKPGYFFKERCSAMVEQHVPCKLSTYQLAELASEKTGIDPGEAAITLAAALHVLEQLLQQAGSASETEAEIEGLRITRVH